MFPNPIFDKLSMFNKLNFVMLKGFISLKLRTLSGMERREPLNIDLFSNTFIIDHEK